MTAADRSERLTRARDRIRSLYSTLFGDARGLVVFLVAVVFLGACWRVGFFITDSHTVANLLANVADGRLAVVEAPYSLTATSQPGLVEVGGQYFGRNYGQVYLAVPVVWLLEGLSLPLDLRLVVAGLWSLAIVGLGSTAADAFDRPRLADVGAVAGVLAALVAVLTRSAIPAVNLHLVALQLTTILVTGVAAVAFYRLLALVDDRRVALAGGLGLVLATPVGFWGTLPKRHVYTAALLLLACYWFAVGRRGTGRRATLARAGAYGVIGYLAAIHAFEAVFMLAVLVPFDLASARSAPLRQHAVVVLVFLLALAPMLATNAAISGDPLQSPRQLPDAGPGGLPPSLGDDAGSPSDPGGGGGSGTGTDGGGGGSSGGDGGSGADDGGSTDGAGPPAGPPEVLAPLVTLLATVAWIGGYMLDTLVAGLGRLSDPQGLYHVFVRSGWIPSVEYAVNGYETVELAWLETFPLAGALLSLPVLAVDRFRRSGGDRTTVESDDGSAITAVDLLVGTMATVFVIAYLSLLPVHSMITLRYLLPAMPLLLYLVCRLGPVHLAVTARGRDLSRGYAAVLGVGGAALLVALTAIDPAVGEAMQFHALLGLTTAALLAAALATWPVHRDERVVALGLALAAGTTTLFLVAAAWWHLQYGAYALDAARLVAETLPSIG